MFLRATLPEPEKPLPQQGLLYFDHLHGEFLALQAGKQGPPITTSASSTVEAIMKKRQDGSLTWNDLYTFDMILSHLQPVEKLTRKVWNLRARYRDVAGLREYDAYLASKPPDWAQAGAMKEKESELRADVEYLLGEIYLRYAITPVRERMRSRIARGLAIVTLIWLAITILITLLVHNPDMAETVPRPRAATLVVVIFVGALGGIVSMQQRYQSLPEEGDALQNVSELISGWHNIYLPAISGATFAAILYLLVLAGMLRGGLFPSMVEDPIYSPKSTQVATQAPVEVSTQPAEKPGSSGVSFVDFLREANPLSRTDYAKLLVWCFLAGFAERFVPDTLSRFTARKEAEADAKN